MKKPNNIFFLLSLALCWSCFAIFTKIGASSASFWLVGFCRCFFGGLPLYLFCFLKKKKLFLKKNFKHYLLIGTFNSAIPFCLYGFSAKTLDSGVLTILDGAILVFEVLITIFILKKSVPRTAILGTTIGIIGIIFTALSGILGFEFNFLSISLVLVAACCYGACSIYISTKCQAIDPIAMAAGSIFIASVLLSPALFFVDLEVLSDLKILFSLMILGIFCTGIAYIFYFTLLREEGSRVAVSTSFLVPILGMILGIIFMQEEVNIIRIMGCILIVLGMKFILNLSLRRAKSQFVIIQQ